MPIAYQIKYAMCSSNVFKPRISALIQGKFIEVDSGLPQQEDALPWRDKGLQCRGPAAIEGPEKMLPTLSLVVAHGLRG